ncbi:hypothetical protein [Silvimonas iriomotensis]|uniref:hypothetical protein n=1 Tax=Silvimonas iriomotensis TaxID=449662 RepID=UPI0016672B85|nr:hypothetical protein [Silvimonas iriomotensis]
MKSTITVASVNLTRRSFERTPAAFPYSQVFSFAFVTYSRARTQTCCDAVWAGVHRKGAPAANPLLACVTAPSRMRAHLKNHRCQTGNRGISMACFPVTNPWPDLFCTALVHAMNENGPQSVRLRAVVYG